MLPNASGWVSTSLVRDAQVVLNWAENVIAKPHPDLGRKGAICPFVMPSIERDKLFMTLHYAVDGQSQEEVMGVIRRERDEFLQFSVPNPTTHNLDNLLVVFPDIPRERGSVIDRAKEALKPEFVELGLMLGEFHPESQVKGVRNPAFHPMVSPFPLVGIRHMEVHDILFLHQDRAWFEAYDLRFGHLHREKRIPPEHGLTDLYEQARRRFAPQDAAMVMSPQP